MNRVDPQFKRRIRDRAQELVSGQRRWRIKVLFDTFSFKKKYKVYNVIFPVWLILAIPSPLWFAVLPGNLAVDCLVCFLALCAVKRAQKGTVLKRVWWRLWLLGFAADAVGIIWLLLGWAAPSLLWRLADSTGAVEPAWLTAWNDTVGHITHNPFAHPAAFFWTLAGVALAGVCIYFWDRRVLGVYGGLDARQRHAVALALAVFTAPWLFFIPVY